MDCPDWATLCLLASGPWDCSATATPQMFASARNPGAGRDSRRSPDRPSWQDQTTPKLIQTAQKGPAGETCREVSPRNLALAFNEPFHQEMPDAQGSSAAAASPWGRVARMGFWMPTSFFGFFFFCLLGPHRGHVEVPRLGVELELPLPATATATAAWDLSHVWDVQHSSWQRQILAWMPTS